MRASASAVWRETTDCRSVCLKRVNFVPAKGIRLWAMVAHMPSAKWAGESPSISKWRGEQVFQGLCALTGATWKIKCLYFPLRWSLSVCADVHVHMCVCMCNSLAPQAGLSVKWRQRIWLSIWDELRSHTALERVHKNAGLCETEDKGLCIKGVHKCVRAFEIRVQHCVSLPANFHPYQSEKRTKIWLFLHMFYVSSCWVLIKAILYLWLVYVVGCISVLCLCASLAYMFILVAG